MTNTTTTPVEILITGALASGKSTLLHLLGGHLKRNGWNVQCFEPDERRPIAPAPSLVNGIQDGRPLVDLALRLLESSEAMTTYLNAHQAELAAGEEPHIFTATQAYADLQQASQDFRHGLELAEALNSQGIADEITCPIQGLIAMHGLLLDVIPTARLKLLYEPGADWRAWVYHPKPDSTEHRVLATGTGGTAAEACDNAIDELLTRPDEVAELLDAEIPY